MWSRIKSISCYIWGIAGIYLVWILIHYFSAHLYIQLCIPYTVVGFLLSPFQAPAPHCVALRYIVYKCGESVSEMWKIIILWICAKI